MIHSIKLTVTSRCPLRCKGCSVEAWRDASPHYEMTMPQVEALAESLKGVRAGELIVSGGEPMTWKHLPDALYLLRPYFDRVRMFTNGMIEPSESFTRATQYIDEVRVSDTRGVAKAFRLQSWAACRVRAKDKGKFKIRPDAPVIGSLPADCECPHIEICGDRAYACSLAQHNAAWGGYPIPEGIVTDVSPGFHERLDLTHVREMPMCAMCVGNRRIKCKTVTP